jgi:tetratricopeptide (TPR) repeat protein
MALSEIEKLERRYAENPHGLTFAPLAEVHRKNGDVQRALELLKPGLQHHPDYIPASIVLGRCHLDLGDLPAAETAFTHVLALDGENVIALKALADINERLHRFDDAERWLNTLLSLDRSNEDARSQLARLELARRQTEMGSAAPGAVEAVAPEAVAEAASLPTGGTLSLDQRAIQEPEGLMSSLPEPAAAWVAEPDAPSVAERSPLVLEELEPSRLDDLDVPPAGLELDEPVRDEEPIAPMPDLVGREIDLPEPATDDFRVETSEEIILESAGGSEFQVPDASQELFSRAPDSAPFGDMAPAAPAPAPVPEADAGPIFEPEPAAVGGDDPSVLDFSPLLVEASGMVPPREEEEHQEDEAAQAVAQTEEPVASAAEPALEMVTAPSEPEAPVTAAAVPDAAPEPAAPEPPAPTEPVPFPPPEPEPVVTETMAEVLLQQGHAAEALRVYRELATRSGDPRLQQRVADLEAARQPPPTVRYSAAETGGQSVGDTLRGILAARLPARPAAPPVRQAGSSSNEGAPTRPAAEALSLSSVFGEETPAAPPAVPAAPAERDRVSFDDFYGGSGPTQAPRGPRTAEPKSDDLDEFHAWLQNLKR